MSENLVIIPTFNEKENIELIIKAVFSLKHPFDILIVDDGSPDGTAEIVKELQKKYPQKLFLEERTGKLGLGTAYIHGFKWGLDRQYKYLYEMDADFSHPPSKLEELYKNLKDDKCDVIVGSRYTRGGGVVNWPFSRKFLSYGASLYVRIITWMPIKDPTAGFVGYKDTVLRTIDLDKIRFIGYAFQIEMKYSAFKRGFKIMEIPIIFKDREAGVSKLSSNIIHEAIFGVWAMVFRFRKKQVANPA